MKFSEIDWKSALIGVVATIVVAAAIFSVVKLFDSCQRENSDLQVYEQVSQGLEMNRKLPKKVYFDTYRHQMSDLPDFNVVKAQEFAKAYPGTA
ncbi:MAG: hypothetical protein IIW70_06710, partial [Bacteroidales bacterium]|nr:hypothetical protein [Bacteroidales bacterium]